MEAVASLPTQKHMLGDMTVSVAPYYRRMVLVNENERLLLVRERK